MKTMPKIGAKVKYRRKATSYSPARQCIGTVVAQYYGGDKHTDPETGEEYVTPDHASVKVSGLPDWWPYQGTDLFAPEVAELTLMRD